MIVFFVGTPGSGKTYEAVKKIADNLKNGRTVCSNIDGMDDPRNQEYLKNLAGLDDFSFKAQFIYLSKADVLQFWKTRTVKKTVFLPNDETDVQERKELICPKGSLIVLDEVHKHFNARSWQSKENLEMADWASTHRHDGYDLVLITQDIDKVEKQVRSLTEWCYFFRKVNFLGGGVQKKYLCYSYSGDDHRGQPLSKNVRTYQAKYFPCYKSYTTSDAKEVGFMTHVNILKHPLFFAIPVVLVFCLWMASKSSLASGDLFGTDKRMKDVSQKIEAERKKQGQPVAPGQVVQRPFSSSTAVPGTPAAAPLPAVVPGAVDPSQPLPPAPPAWHSYPVSGRIEQGGRVLYLVHGVMLRPGQCRNYNPTFKTIECFGTYIASPAPSVSVAAVSHDDSQPTDSKHVYDPPSKITAFKSQHLSDSKVKVDVK